MRLRTSIVAQAFDRVFILSSAADN